MNLNKAELIGNVTRDPEAKTMPSGKNIVKFGIATNYKWKDKNSGEMKNEVEYHDCVAFGKLADVVIKYIKKGDKTYIDGRLKTSHWEDQSGTKRQKTSIVVTNLIMLGNKKEDTQSSEGVQPESPGEPEISVEEIPF